MWDDDVRRFANFATEFAKQFNLGNVEGFQKIEQGVEHFLDTKSAGQVDSAEIRKIKSLIRSTEARSAARYTGVQPENIHFCELPFYETGTVKKKPLGEEDVRIVAELLRKVKPHQIYAAGDLSDPHGTHRVCLQAVMKALHVIKTEEWFKDCQLWLYRGAWQEWDPEDIEMAIPMSPQELEQKRKSYSPLLSAQILTNRVQASQSSSTNLKKTPRRSLVVTSASSGCALKHVTEPRPSCTISLACPSTKLLKPLFHSISTSLTTLCRCKCGQ